MPDTDPRNPKDAIGSKKIPAGLFPSTAIIAGSLGIYEGLLKYGKTNWRATPVLASIYYDACQRHLLAWSEGQELDPITHVPHLGNALACIAILIDAQAHGTLIDDRVHPSDAYFKYRAAHEATVEHLQIIFQDANPTQFTREFVLAQREAAQSKMADELSNSREVKLRIPNEILGILQNSHVTTEQVLQEGIKALIGKRTKIKITTRVSPAKKAKKSVRAAKK